MTERQHLQEVLFQEHLDSVYRRRDRVFAWLMLAQWVFGVCIALVYSPYGWEGKVQSTHLHVYYALFVGGALSDSTILLTIFRPGWAVTRHVVAVAQMLWSALLIHLTGGRIETHFHVFGSLAFLAFYRDWKLLISATIVVAGDHLLRGLFWAESVYGITNPEWWRFLEHAFWVVFENVVLVMGILESHREMRALAARQTDLEERVTARTAEVVTAKREVSDILDNMAQAIFTVGEDGTISREFSAHCQTLFTTDRIAGRTPNRSPRARSRRGVRGARAHRRLDLDRDRRRRFPVAPLRERSSFGNRPCRAYHRSRVCTDLSGGASAPGDVHL